MAIVTGPVKRFSSVAKSCIRRNNMANMDVDKFQPVDIVLVCGLPGAGKSHFSRNYFNHDGRKRVNRKELRRLLWEMTSFGEPWSEELFNEHDEGLVHHVERKIIEHLLQNRHRILVDNTSVTAESRRPYIHIAQQARRTIGVVFLNVPIQKCLARNRSRDDQMSEAIITNLYAALELPEKREGFDEVLVLPDY